ncbi:hypothetical protein C7N43_38125 [Sphingobacteriales bacterium UPWRP_1]|nr:hypothetical protein B6N25_06660 [Sphingobacteriales bacterium TSM_CSS]PSJ71670.1 hypothetical protein C7N43_38125 [Sphingobacteriales bacterium UPWRP_1]
MKNLLSRFMRLFTAFFTSFWRTPAPDGEANGEITPQKPKTMFENPVLKLPYNPTKPARKIKAHNNRKCTRGRRFVYVNGRRQAIANNW